MSVLSSRTKMVAVDCIEQFYFQDRACRAGTRLAGYVVATDWEMRYRRCLQLCSEGFSPSYGIGV